MMKNSENKKSILGEKSKLKTFSEHHQNELGMNVPENFFTQSKESIMDLVKEEKKSVPVFYLQRSFQVAASIAVLVILTFVFQLSSNKEAEVYVASDDVLIESLLVEDGSINTFLEDVLVAEVVVEAEKSEQELENVFLNSLFVEDTLLDDYTKKSLLDHVIL